MKGELLRQVVWTSAKPPGVEYCTVKARPSGWLLEGTVVRRASSGPAVLAYSIRTDLKWRTKKVEVEQLYRGRRRTLQLKVRGTRWFVNGKEDRRFRKCHDVDLNASPVTNTLPVKRARLRVGARAELTACWVKFPSLSVAPLKQSYERAGKRLYRYRSASGFSADVEFDSFGLVRKYGDYWVAV